MTTAKLSCGLSLSVAVSIKTKSGTIEENPKKHYNYMINAKLIVQLSPILSSEVSLSCFHHKTSFCYWIGDINLLAFRRTKHENITTTVVDHK